MRPEPVYTRAGDGALAAAGLSPHYALAAGSWAARSYLGLPGPVSGAPADAVVYDTEAHNPGWTLHPDGPIGLGS